MPVHHWCGKWHSDMYTVYMHTKHTRENYTLLQYCMHCRDVTINRYITYCIVIRQYCCIDTKSNRIDILRIVIYQHMYCGLLAWLIIKLLYIVVKLNS